jgi:plasmid stability protein
MASRQPITVRLPHDLHAEVERRAQREHRSLANTLVAIITDALTPHPTSQRLTGANSGDGGTP